MASFVVAYLVVWSGLSLYVLKLGAAQRRLAGELAALQARSEQPAGAGHAGHTVPQPHGGILR